MSESRKEIYTYNAPWPIFGLAWSHRTNPNAKFRLACGSFMEEYSNKVQIVKKKESDPSGQFYDPNPNANPFFVSCEFDHPYPCTKILWSPATEGKDLMATTGDYLRLWDITDDGKGTGHDSAKQLSLLDNNKNSEYCAPLTSFDWNETDPSIIGTSSIDTTCTIWDVNTCQARTQLIAHDAEVFDIAFARGKDVFASCGADGSVRMFDLRSLEHSTIIYESPVHDAKKSTRRLTPLIRLGWNKQDPNYLATFSSDKSFVVILDIRVPSMPVAELKGHTSAVNAVSWAPHSSSHICTCGDDSKALIWDLQTLPRPVEEPILAYDAKSEINNMIWSAAQPDWISIAFQNKLQILRV